MLLSAEQKKYIKGNYRKLSVKKLAKTLQADPADILHYISDSQKNQQTTRHRIYRIILIIFPVIVFGLLESGLSIFNYGGKRQLFVNAPQGYEQYLMANQEVSRRYFYRQRLIPSPPFDLFLKIKPENGFRIFVLGGSTAAGYPFGNNLMFSRILNRQLQDAFPEKKIEVINVAMAAINSYSLLDFMDEILKEQPDLILAYAGHNEFYGALGVASSESIGRHRWMVNSYISLGKYKTFLLVRNTLRGFLTLFNSVSGTGQSEDATATLMERLVADQKIIYHSDLYEKGLHQFSDNLEGILHKAARAKVPVILSELVSNIKDQQPFISIQTPRYPAAAEIYKEAAHQLQKKDYVQARKNFYLAKDLDALRFRAPEEFNEIIHVKGEAYQFLVVPMVNAFEEESADCMIGNDLMLEHLHPNINGYFVMADAFFNTIVANHYIDSQDHQEALRKLSYYRHNWGYTAVDSLYGALRIHILRGGWPFKPKSAPNRALLDYEPASRADSLAVRVWTEKNYTLERAHVELAEFYDNRHQYQDAFAEYRALIAMTPFNVSPYLRAADMLLKQQKLTPALQLLQQSMKLEETSFALKWIGQILLAQNKKDEAVPFLEKASRLLPNDPQLLYNLGGAYAMKGQYDKSKSILDRLLQISPGFPDAARLRQQVDNLLKQNSEKGNDPAG